MKITVLYGGLSAEREISLKSGKGVAEALRSRGHDVTLLDPAAPRGQLDGPGAVRIAGAPDAPQPVELARMATAPAIRDTEVVFIALHGGEGENGTLQAVLELADVAYTGSGVLASAVAMDKHMSKQVFMQCGVPTPAWVWRRRGESAALTAEEMKRLGGYPLVVKPNDQGSTIGLSVIQEAVGLPAAADLAWRYSRSILVETFIPGRELSVPVMSGRALPVIEIRPKHGIYDYECKYTRGGSNYLCPAPLEPAHTRRVQELAAAAYDSLQCEGVARVDFRLDPGGEPWCLEVNTVPGMTETSLVPMAAQAEGTGFAELVEKMCADAVESRRRRHEQPV